MKININERDKKLLIILGIIVIAFIIYNFILSPQYERNVDLRSQLESYKLEYDRTYQIVEKVDSLKKEESELKIALTEKYKTFFYEINEERILHKLDTAFSNSTFPVKDYIQTEPEVKEITIAKSNYKTLDYPLLTLAQKSNPALLDEPEEKNLSNQNEASETDENNTSGAEKTDDVKSDALPCIEITIGFDDAGYSSIINFIKLLESMDRSAIIKDIRLSKKSNSNNLAGEMMLAIYSLPKIDINEKNDIVFKSTLPKGKANPFIFESIPKGGEN